MRTSRRVLGLVWLVTVCTVQARAADLGPLLETLRAVGPEAAGSRQAAQAWEQLVQADAAQLPIVLAAMDGAGPLAANWIRTAVDAIAQRQLREGGRLPAAELEQFVLDRRHAPRARRVAYELLLQVDPAAEDRLIPGMLDDKSLEMRRDAVARLIDEGTELLKADQKSRVVAVSRRALSAARDLDQIRLLVPRLRKLGHQVDLPRHMGFLVRWKLIGPFDNTGEKGFDVVYPPEREIDPEASYQGKHGPVRWTDYATTDDFGKVDLNKAVAEEKGVVAYATVEFLSDRRQEVELRLTSSNAVKLWLGGKLIDRHNVYHAGSQLDHYTTRVVLQPGANVILLKVCQNEQTQDWARQWNFQLRVCDAGSAAVFSADREEATRPEP